MPDQPSTTKQETSTAEYIQTVGRRKTSSARVRLYLEPGESQVNYQPIEQYFPGEVNRFIYTQPLQLTQQLDKLHFTVLVEGGGPSSQVQAVAHGLARALVKFNPEFRSVLRQHGLLTRDPRMKERRKPGHAQKARAKKSSPKR